MWFYKRSFTLLELMIVVIIVGILASLAIPRFIAARDKAIMAEAQNMLGAIRGSQFRYYLEHDNDYATGLGDLDLEVGYSRYFSYSAANNAAGSSYLGGATGLAESPMNGKALWINVDGNVGKGTALP